MNPFVFDTFATGKDFCGREEEISRLSQYISDSKNVLIYSKRRLGKSSLIKEVLNNRLENQKYCLIYIDLFEIIDEHDFAKLLYKETSKTIGVYYKNALKKIAILFKKARISASVNENGDLEYSPTLASSNFDELIEDAFSGLTSFLNDKNIKGVVAFDEFQQIASIKHKKIDAIIRKYIQSHKNISYIFCGSRRHLLTSLFNKQSAPLYEMAIGFQLKEIEPDSFYEFVSERMNASISRDVFEHLYKRCNGESKLIQHVSYYLYNQSFNAISIEDVNNAIDKIVNEADGEFRIILENLSQVQKNALRAVVTFNGEDLFKKDNLIKINTTKDSLSSAVKSLYNKELIDREEDKYFVNVRKFELWCKKVFLT